MTQLSACQLFPSPAPFLPCFAHVRVESVHSSNTMALLVNIDTVCIRDSGIAYMLENPGDMGGRVGEHFGDFSSSQLVSKMGYMDSCHKLTVSPSISLVGLMGCGGLLANRYNGKIIHQQS